MNVYRAYFKRPLDIALSAAALLLSSPVTISGLLAIRASSRGPVLYRQVRAGLNGEPFTIYKIRTMTNVEVSGPASTPQRILPVGRLLRRLKIDEIPQLVNVIKGDMSLIGPRPCLLVTRDKMPPWAAVRFRVRPGLTGLAQVNGNIALSWEERWAHDERYVVHGDFAMDMHIVAKTVLIVLFGEGRFRRVA